MLLCESAGRTSLPSRRVGGRCDRLDRAQERRESGSSRARSREVPLNAGRGGGAPTLRGRGPAAAAVLVAFCRLL
eukprot:scaffold6357_cov248-Pinguiococcus_pyrenoidosus.AAC.1